MDGVHDLGGKEGFGRISVDEPEVPFHSDWEGRMLGIVRSMSRAEDWSLDWFRHCRELIDPTDYLSRPYYDQWMQTYAAMMVNSGMATIKEIAAGKSETDIRPDGISVPANPADFRNLSKVESRYDRPVQNSPRFNEGSKIRTLKHGKPGHTRLPAYARDKTGTVIAFRGDFIFPDDTAHGEESYEHLYTVAFDSVELWGNEKARNERIFLDLWESYLVPA